jgi:Truncated hemoglobins
MKLRIFTIDGGSCQVIPRLRQLLGNFRKEGPMKDLRSGTWTALVAVLSMTAVAIGCLTMDAQAGQGAKQSLYDRLGGKSAITAVIDQFVANVANDKRISDRFATTDIPKLKKNLVDQVCTASGGPLRLYGPGHEDHACGYEYHDCRL